ncbi:MAG: glycosyltransferase family 4 protein [Elusimicrobia bacterium]|nr:glycosyltransferase family 4 protein [Elusimicrobiota bacterium]
MRIAFVLKKYSRTGGISRYVAELAERYALENEVHVFASQWRDVGTENITFHKVPMLDFSILRKLKKHALNNLFEVASFLFFSRFRINRGDFDIVHIQGDYMGAADVYTAHSCHRAWLDIANREKLGPIERFKKSAFNPLHFLILLIEKDNLRRSSSIIALSRREVDFLSGNYGVSREKITSIPHGVDMGEFDPDKRPEAKEKVRRRLGVPDESVLAIFSAHEFRRKGLGQIIEAFSILGDKNLYLMAVGKDDPVPYGRLIRDYGLEGRIIFTGGVSDISDYYAASDIFILPTKYEPFGLVILEAMASGLPVVTSEKAGAAELIEDGKTGLLLKNEQDPYEIAEKLKILKRDRSLRHSMGAGARDTAGIYSWDSIARRTFDIYRKVLETRKA